MEKFISTVFMNFFGYDFFIFIAAAVTLVVYFRLKKAVNELSEKMHPTIHISNGVDSSKQVHKEIYSMKEDDVVNMRKRMGKLYSVFVNLTGIFPLLGILGTIISLLNMVSSFNDVQGNFYGALTSTFWGLVFAIIYKFLDGIISARIEDNEQAVALYLDRNSETHPVIKSEEKP